MAEEEEEEQEHVQFHEISTLVNDDEEDNESTAEETEDVGESSHNYNRSDQTHNKHVEIGSNESEDESGNVEGDTDHDPPIPEDQIDLNDDESERNGTAEDLDEDGNEHDIREEEEIQEDELGDEEAENEKEHGGSGDDDGINEDDVGDESDEIEQEEGDYVEDDRNEEDEIGGEEESDDNVRAHIDAAPNYESANDEDNEEEDEQISSTNLSIQAKELVRNDNFDSLGTPSLTSRKNEGSQTSTFPKEFTVEPGQLEFKEVPRQDIEEMKTYQQEQEQINLTEEYNTFEDSTLRSPNEHAKSMEVETTNVKRVTFQEDASDDIFPATLLKTPLEQVDTQQTSYVKLQVKEALSINFSRDKVWYDEPSEALILVRRGEFRTISLVNKPSPLNPSAKIKAGDVFLRFRYDGATLDIGVSPCHRFVGIRRNDTQVSMITLPSNLESTIECRGKGNALLRGGLVWIPTTPVTKPASLCLVTKQGLETYSQKNAPNGGTFTNVSSVSLYNSRCFWWLPTKSIVCVSTDEGDVRPFFLAKDSAYPEKWVKFQIEAPYPEAGDAALVELYGDAWLIRVRPQEMVLYRLRKEGSSINRVVRSFAGITSGISFIDSVLLAHSQNTKVSLMYDVADLSSDLPFAHPLPLSVTSEENETPITPYGTSWVFLPPFWVLDARLGKIWKLELDLKACVRSSSANDDPEKLCRFLLRRVNKPVEARMTLFDLMREAIVGERETEYEDLMHLLPYLKVIAEHVAITEQRKQHKGDGTQTKMPVNFVEVAEKDFYEGFCDRLPNKENNPSFIASVLLEFAMLLQTFGSTASDTLYSKIAGNLVKAGRTEELYQLCLFQVPIDSVSLVQTVLGTNDDEEEHEREVSAERKQVGLDCLKRLNHPLATFEELIKQDAYEAAIRYASHYQLLIDDAVVITLIRNSNNNRNRLCMLHNMLNAQRSEWLKERKINKLVSEVSIPPEFKAAFGCD